MSEKPEKAFSALVGKRLTSNEASSELWRPVAQELDRDGPEVAAAYLDAEQKLLEERVQKLLKEFAQE